MRNLRWGMLLGLLFLKDIGYVQCAQNMEQALAELENGQSGSGNNTSDNNTSDSNIPSEPSIPNNFPPNNAASMMPQVVNPSMPPVATPPAMVPPVATPPAMVPPVATPPAMVPPVATPPAMVPPVATPPAMVPPVATPPTMVPPMATSPAATPPSVETTVVGQPKVTLQVSDVHSAELDTINIDSGGNWLEKRIWFKKAESLFDDIRKTVEKATDIRVEFVDAVNAVDKKIDNFYDVVSFDKGQLDELLKNVSRKISDATVKREGDLSDKERALYQSIQAEQKQIVQIGDDIKKIEDFDLQIDKTMGQAFKTIDACRALENTAWENFKAIGAELDDKKARTLYYEMENAYKNIQQHISYLKGTLFPYLQSKLVTPVDNFMVTITHNVKALEAKGIHLGKLLSSDEQKDVVVEQQREVAQEKEAEKKWEQQEQAKEQQKEKEVAAKAKIIEEENVAWYIKFVHSMGDKFHKLSCYLLEGLRLISCKIYDLAPHFFETMKTSFSFAIDFFAQIPCYVNCLICSIKSMMCNWFGA